MILGLLSSAFHTRIILSEIGSDLTRQIAKGPFLLKERHHPSEKNTVSIKEPRTVPDLLTSNATISDPRTEEDRDTLSVTSAFIEHVLLEEKYPKYR